MIWKAFQRLGDEPRRLDIITFSGAHGVGKSTIVSDLTSSIQKSGDTVLTIPSISTVWFKGYQKFAAENSLPVPQTYDDINRLGIRQMMQMEMPALLAESILSRLPPKLTSDTIILVDRWFSDIMAYTALELPEDVTVDLAKMSQQVYQRLMDRLTAVSNSHNGSLYLTHVFVPAASCAHEMPRGQTADKAHRGTQPSDQWEQAYARFNTFTEPERTLVLTTSDRVQRVAEITAATWF